MTHPEINPTGSNLQNPIRHPERGGGKQTHKENMLCVTRPFPLANLSAFLSSPYLRAHIEIVPLHFLSYLLALLLWMGCRADARVPAQQHLQEHPAIFSGCLAKFRSPCFLRILEDAKRPGKAVWKEVSSTNWSDIVGGKTRNPGIQRRPPTPRATSWEASGCSTVCERRSSVMIW